MVETPKAPWQSKQLWINLLQIVLVFVILDAFLVSINLLGIFKSASHGHFEALMTKLATSPFLGLMLGILATAVFQSSSTTTSLVVGLVAVDFLGLGLQATLQACIPIVIGANIGTSVTNTLVSIGHFNNRKEFYRAFSAAIVHDVFNVLTVIILLPLQITTNFIGKIAGAMAIAFADTGGLKFVSPLKMLIKPQAKWVIQHYDHSFLIQLTMLFFVTFLVLLVLRWLTLHRRNVATAFTVHALAALTIALIMTLFFQHAGTFFTREVAVLVFGLATMFFSLIMLVKLMKAIMLSKLEVLFHRYVFKTALRSLVMGWLLTILVQSSSITTSLMVPLAGAGLLTIYQVFPFTLGANVGTTVTALLAALSTGQIAPIAVAFSHLVFNLLGLAIFYFIPMRLIPIRLSRYLAYFSIRWRAFPFVYVIVLFFVIPFACVYFF